MSDKMPVVFVGHGSPMNAVEDNEFSRTWHSLGETLPRPRAILAVSAHWPAAGTMVCADAKPKMIYDMYGFPDELYRVNYPAPGSPELAARALELLGEGSSAGEWGLDHGVWSVLHSMYPDAGIPVVPLSTDMRASPDALMAAGARLAPLRDEGVLILASGNVVHNLSLVSWSMDGGYPWADEFDDWVCRRVVSGRFSEVARWKDAGECALRAFASEDHFRPLLYALGAAGDARAEPFCRSRVLGALSMTGYIFN